LVLQSSTLGIDQLKSFIVEQLLSMLPETIGIYEKSPIFSRKEEQLPPFEGTIWGTVPPKILIKENGIQFVVHTGVQPASTENNIANQKSGFFLDQREMRFFLASSSNLYHGKNVLDLFSYTGAFGVYAAVFGAKKICFVDSSRSAILLAKENLELNQDKIKDNPVVDYETASVFDWLRTKNGKQVLSDSNVVIVDPPAFVKKRGDRKEGLEGYKDINRLVFAGVKPGTIILTCSCSFHISSEEFRTVIWQAADEAKKDVRILSHHLHGLDHIENVNQRESQNYLKALLLLVL